MDHDTYQPRTFSIPIKGVVVRAGLLLSCRGTNAGNANP